VPRCHGAVVPGCCSAVVPCCTILCQGGSLEGRGGSTCLAVGEAARLLCIAAGDALCTLHTAHCTLHTAHYTLHTAHCTLHTTHFTPTRHTAHCTLHTAHYTLHTSLRTRHAAHCCMRKWRKMRSVVCLIPSACVRRVKVGISRLDSGDKKYGGL
jgi:hypothetical protein